MNVLLICKGEYRYFFPAIARELRQQYGARVSAVSFSTAATRMLLKTDAFSDLFNLAGWLRERVPKMHADVTVDKLRNLESVPCAAPINTMIYADRILRRYPHDRIAAILGSVADFWDEVLEEAFPDVVVGEVACASEWIGWLKAKGCDIPYLIPSATPVDGRCYFLDSPDGMWTAMQSAFEELKGRELSDDEIATAEDFIRSFRERMSKPMFLEWAQHSPLRPELARFLRRLVRIPFRIRTYVEDGEFEIGSHHGTAPWSPVREDIVRIVRHTAAELCHLSHGARKNRPYLYFPLHVQPEFTTDVRAPLMANQIALIENISKSVPAGYEIIVKEHPGMKGERRLGEYRALKRLHNVSLISASFDSHELIRSAVAVLTITGSSAWEAILYEKPVIAFGPLCYGFCSIVHACDNLRNLSEILSQALNRSASDRDELLKFVLAFLRTAHEMQWGDPVRQEQILKQRNVRSIANAIREELDARATSARQELISA